MSEFGLTQLRIPRFDVVSHQTPQQIAQRPISDLRLTVRLRMVRRAHIKRSTK